MAWNTRLTAMRYWCQKVLPQVYDDSISYYEVLNKVVTFLNETIEKMNELITEQEEFEADINAQWTAYKENLNAEWEAYKTLMNDEWKAYKVLMEGLWEAFQEDMEQWKDDTIQDFDDEIRNLISELEEELRIYIDDHTVHMVTVTKSGSTYTSDLTRQEIIDYVNGGANVVARRYTDDEETFGYEYYRLTDISNGTRPIFALIRPIASNDELTGLVYSTIIFNPSGSISVSEHSDRINGVFNVVFECLQGAGQPMEYTCSRTYSDIKTHIENNENVIGILHYANPGVEYWLTCGACHELPYNNGILFDFYDTNIVSTSTSGLKYVNKKNILLANDNTFTLSDYINIDIISPAANDVKKFPKYSYVGEIEWKYIGFPISIDTAASPMVLDTTLTFNEMKSMLDENPYAIVLTNIPGPEGSTYAKAKFSRTNNDYTNLVFDLFTYNSTFGPTLYEYVVNQNLEVTATQYHFTPTP